ncbi:MAG: hypothetical protein KIH63_003915 [Candidatus Saccharibacteria bacterium]|nr:hypothetical protein [Candidatus Saccharibacteria bacterium]
MISSNLMLQLYWLDADLPEPDLPVPEPPDDGVAPPPTRDDPVDDPLP